MGDKSVIYAEVQMEDIKEAIRRFKNDPPKYVSDVDEMTRKQIASTHGEY